MNEIIAIMAATMEKFFVRCQIQADLSRLDKQLCSLSKNEDFYFHQGKWHRRGIKLASGVVS